MSRHPATGQAGRPRAGCPQSARGMRILRLPFLAVLLSAGAHPQPWLVRGTVTDAATGHPLSAATVQLAGTWRGTIANDEGEYLLEVRGLPAVLKVSYIGYASRDSVLAAAPGRVDFALTPVPFRFEPVVVTAEDPAEAIMREVIRRKQEWRPGLAGYRAEAYTRRVLENEKEIVLIGELASEIYWDRERGLREVVKSRRVTRNQGPDAGYVSALQGFLNFYDDDIPFIGHELIGPTHPDALEQYRFRLAGRRYLDDKVVFDISVEPRNRLQSALAGSVSVLDGEFALLEAELAPSRGSVSSAVPLPVIEQMDVAWRQQFRRFAAGVWLPVDYRASMKVKVGVAGLRFPAARFNQVTRLGEYEVNVDMPDSLYAGRRSCGSIPWRWRRTAPLRGWPTRCPCRRGKRRRMPASTAPCVSSGHSGPRDFSPASSCRSPGRRGASMRESVPAGRGRRTGRGGSASRDWPALNRSLTTTGWRERTSG